MARTTFARRCRPRGQVAGLTALPVAEPRQGHESGSLGDTRFRMLLGADAWQRLPPRVRSRFSKRLGPDDVALYRGRVAHTRLSLAGRALATLLRLIGAPLPLENGATGPAVVSVTECPAVGGQIWTRSYPRTARFPQVVHSMKRFRGPTGLEEYVGRGVGMTLALSVEGGGLRVAWEPLAPRDGHQRYLLRWEESGGPPVESPPDPGTGTDLIKGLCKSELHGRVELDYPSGGARHRFEIVLDEQGAGQFDHLNPDK